MGDLGHKIVVISLAKRGIAQDLFHPKMDGTVERGLHVIHHTMAQEAGVKVYKGGEARARSVSETIA
ncbi:hypothetical protein CRYUN_Cryun25bG0046100 [Craigia yunnanensis]